MKILEKEIEDLIYENPWIINERYIIPKISGSGGKYGRQVDVGKSARRPIDLLFKDTSDNRPVIIEVKRERIGRKCTGQILEYRGLIVALDEEKREQWLKEFGINYYSPKMLIIGQSADTEVLLSANLTGIEIRTFGDLQEKDFGFDKLNELKIKLKEWGDFRRSGNRTLIERNEWVNKIIGNINKMISDIEDVTTIITAPEIPIGKYYANNTSPFIDIPIFYKKDFLFGFYEYFDKDLPFDEAFIYSDFCLAENFDNDKKADIYNEITLFFKSNGFDYIEYSIDKLPVLKLPRETFESNEQLKKTLRLLIKKGVELYNKHIS